MPLYRCAIREGLSNETQRGQIAKEVVRIHCGVTHRVENLLVQKQRHQPAQAIPRHAVQTLTGRYATERLQEVVCRDKVVAQIAAAPPTPIQGDHDNRSWPWRRLLKNRWCSGNWAITLHCVSESAPC